MVFIRPFSIPKASSRTLIIGTKQLVVHEAFDTMVWLAGSKVSSLTPTTKGASTWAAGGGARGGGARRRPPRRPRCRGGGAGRRGGGEKNPVDSTTTSMPRSPH